MISKELLEKAKKCTTKEEILELAKAENVEISDENIANLLSCTETNKELSDDELENVAGGTCHSDWTYAKLGITPAYPQRPEYHPVITTQGNNCNRHQDYPGFWITCHECNYHYVIGPTVYCRIRSREYETAS